MVHLRTREGRMVGMQNKSKLAKWLVNDLTTYWRGQNMEKKSK